MVFGDISLFRRVSADLGTHDGGLLQGDSVIHGQKEDDIGELTSLGRDDAAREEED